MSQTMELAKPRSGFPALSPGALSTLSDLGVPLAVLGVVVALITPLPGFVLDLLIVLDIMTSVIVMMVALYIGRPVEFSVFPTVLLLLTLFRLALNVSSSRLILLNGNSGTAAAGHVIEAFGSFVVGGNYIIGAVIFCVLIAIQYVVINHGAVRISEVTARFTLDALPGKQMSIDADLNGGLIDDTEAKRRRKELSNEAEFYGAMDGACRFTQRDAVASLLITAINIIAGFLIGVLQHGMDLLHALQTYTVLTIGDGLVTVIPALMISISGGLIVTRTTSDVRLGTEFRKQLFTKDQPLMLASGILCSLALLPGMPAFPFLLVGGALGGVSWNRSRKASGSAAASRGEEKAKAAPQENLETLLQVDPIAVEVGFSLIKLVEGGPNSPFLQRISVIRKTLAAQLGYLLPPVKVNDNIALGPREYSILLKGAEVGRYELLSGHELAIPAGGSDPGVAGSPTREPAFGLAAVWVSAERVEVARSKGYTVVDAVSVLGTHLSEIIKRHAHELFTRQEAKAFCDRVAQTSPKLVEDVVSKMLSLAVIQRVLQNLLRERVSIRDSVSIIEALGEAAPMTKNPILLTEYARQAIRRAIIKPFLKGSEVSAFLLEASSEQAIERTIEHGEHNSILGLAPQTVREILSRVRTRIETADPSAVIITNAAVRHFFRQMIEPALPQITVLSHNEVPPEVKIRSLGWIG